MRRALGLALALWLGLGVTSAWAGDVRGTITSIDIIERVIVLDDGRKLWVAEWLPIEDLKEGTYVIAFYEERDGRHVATSVEVTD